MSNSRKNSENRSNHTLPASLLAQCDKPQGVWGTGPPGSGNTVFRPSSLAYSKTAKLNVTLNQYMNQTVARDSCRRRAGPSREEEPVLPGVANNVVLLAHAESG